MIKDFSHDQKIAQKALAYHKDRRNLGIAFFLLIQLALLSFFVLSQIGLFPLPPEYRYLALPPEAIAIAVLANTLKKFSRINKSYEGYVYHLEFDVDYIKEGESFNILLHLVSTDPSTKDQKQTYTLFSSNQRNKTKKLARSLQAYYDQAYVIKTPGLLLPQKIDGYSTTTNYCLVCGTRKQSPQSVCPKCNLPSLS